MKKIIFLTSLSLYLLFIFGGKSSELYASGFKEYFISITGGTLESVLDQIEKQTPYTFAYNNDDIDKTQRIEFYSSNKKLKEVLNIISQQYHFSFNLINNVIYITQNKKKQSSISGYVKDVNGNPLLGASVLEKGTSNGVSTNINGEFSIQLTGDNALLVVSFMGYKTQEVLPENNLIIILQEDLNNLNDVIVVGYGSQKKRDLTGAVSSIGQKDIEEINTPNPIQALKGKIAGVDIYNSGNQPGADMNIRIRGQRSIGASNRPLIVLDGIPITDGFNEINPNDILSIEVLKDASATAIYGSRASNGVILMTTKRGTTGETEVAYSGYYGITSTINNLDLMNGEEFAQLRREANRTVLGTYPNDADIFDNIALESLNNNIDTNWQDFTYNKGHKQNHQLSIKAGNEKTQFLTSFNFFEEQGIVDNSSFTRGSLRLNIDQKINDKLNFGASSFISRSKQEVMQNDLYDNVLRLSPLGMPYDENGEILFRPTNDEGQRVNPLSDLENSVDDRFKTKIFASVFGKYQITKNLSYRLNVGPDIQHDKRGYFYGSLTTNNQGGASSAGISNSEVTSITVENILNYDDKFGKDHIVNTTLVQSYQNQVTKSDYTNVKNLPYDTQEYNNLGSAGEVTGVGSNYKKWRLLSYMARINYHFKDRYLFTLTGRADGSSRFSEGNKWGFFPTAALAWQIADEPFFEVSEDIISNLKLRISYGKTGNTGIDPYQTFSTLSSGNYAFGDNGVLAYSPGSISNPNLKWETTKQLNIGLDFEVWKKRVTGSINYYVAKTEDLLLPRSIPSSTGFSSVLENVGETQNKGIEVNLSFLDIIPSKDFRWQADLTFSKNTNEITKLLGDGTDDVGNLWFIGESINVFYDYRKTGIWQTDEAAEAAEYGFEPGQIKIEDVNNDGKLDADDRVILGSPTPDWIGGLTNRFSYKGINLSVMLHTRQNNMIYSRWYENNNRLAGRYNNLDVDYWTPENPTNDNPRPNVSQESVYLGSTLAYKDVSFVRVRNIALSYSLPLQLCEKLNMRAFTFTLTADNPFTITNYNGLDPEFESDNTRAEYPSTKMYSIGLNVTF